jgi:2-keto-3-deoxy-L-rhamnonate aldolase RhmA
VKNDRLTLTRRRLLALASAAAIASQVGAQQSLAAESSGAPKAAKKSRTLQERLATKQALLGLLQMYPNRALEELADGCGYDFLMVDGEHGVFGEEDIRETLKTLETTQILTLLRVPKLDPLLAERYLELGADVIVAPLVSTVEDARTMARATASHKGSLIVILETKLGVENAEEILAVAGVDGAIIGPTDLSTDLGIKGQYAHPAYAEAFSRIERAAAMNNKPLGTIPHGDYSLEALGARGHRLFILTSDHSLLREALNAQADLARSMLKLSEA